MGDLTAKVVGGGSELKPGGQIDDGSDDLGTREKGGTNEEWLRGWCKSKGPNERRAKERDIIEVASGRERRWRPNGRGDRRMMILGREGSNGADEVGEG